MNKLTLDQLKLGLININYPYNMKKLDGWLVNSNTNTVINFSGNYDPCYLLHKVLIECDPKQEEEDHNVICEFIENKIIEHYRNKKEVIT